MPPPAPVPRRTAVLGLVAVGLGTLPGPMDSAVNVAFPALTQAFDLTLADIQWIVIPWVLAQASLTLAFGKLGDLFGHRRVFIAGMLGCIVAHLACALAPDYRSLVALRFVQGLAVGLAMSCGPALATLLFEPRLQRRILGIYVTAFGVGFAAGPLAAGPLLAAFGWPAVFWFRAPIALLALVLILFVPSVRAPGGADARPVPDVGGACWLLAAMSGLVALLNLAGRAEPRWPVVAAVGIATAAAFAAFVRHERRHPQPILDPSLMRRPDFGALHAIAIVFHLGAFSILLLGPYLLSGAGGASFVALGLLLALYPAGSVLAGLAGTALTARIGSRRLLQAGIAVVGVCLLAIGLWSGDLAPGASGGAASGLAPLAVAMFVAGLGLGLFQLGYMDLTVSMLPVQARGVAGSLANVTRLIGIVSGAALLLALNRQLGADGSAAAGFARTFGATGAALLLLALASVALPRPSGPTDA